ncbi:hypothetical protein C3L33_10337, partial [Rhododendron williamsianum]
MCIGLMGQLSPSRAGKWSLPMVTKQPWTCHMGHAVYLDFVGGQLEKCILMIYCMLFLCRSNIVEAHTQVLSLLKSEYSHEEIQGIINMTSIQDLQQQLDSLL